MESYNQIEKNHYQKLKRNHSTATEWANVSEEFSKTLKKIMAILYEKLRKEQAEFRISRGTTEQVSILRNNIEQVNEWQATLYTDFIDFEKTFDSIHRDSI